MVNKNIELQKEKTCCFAGHRYISDIIKCRALLKEKIGKLVDDGVNAFIFSGSFGFELIAMDVLYSSFILPGNAVNMVFLLPNRFEEQMKIWTNKRDSDSLSFYINEVAAEIICVSDRCNNNFVKERNRCLIEMSAYCICNLEREQSGAGQIVRLAKKHGVKIINI